MKGKEYSPFKMKAAKYNNSPMQKNFGEHLAMNKKIDADANHSKPGQPSPMRLYDEVNSDVNKLNRVDMEGGLTGAPSTGRLDGPMEEGGPMMMKKQSPMKLKGKKSPMKMKAKKSPMTKGNMGAVSQAKKAGIKPGGPMSGIGMMKNLGGGMANKPGVVKPGKFNSAANKAKRAKFKSDVGKFTGGLGKSVKQLGTQISSGGKKVISNVKSGKPLTSGTFMGKGGGKIKAAADKRFKTKTRKSSGSKVMPMIASIAPMPKSGFKPGGFKPSILSPTQKGKKFKEFKPMKLTSSLFNPSGAKKKPVTKTDFTKVKGSTTYKPKKVVKKTKKKKSILESIKPTPMNLPGFKFY